MSDFLKKVFKKDPNIVHRQIDDEAILVPIAHSSDDLNCIYNLNTVGLRIWQLIDGRRDIKKIKETLLEEFSVKPEKLEKDIKEFIGDLEKAGCVK